MLPSIRINSMGGADLFVFGIGCKINHSASGSCSNWYDRRTSVNLTGFGVLFAVVAEMVGSVTLAGVEEAILIEVED